MKDLGKRFLINIKGKIDTEFTTLKLKRYI